MSRVGTEGLFAVPNRDVYRFTLRFTGSVSVFRALGDVAWHACRGDPRRYNAPLVTHTSHNTSYVCMCGPALWVDSDLRNRLIESGETVMRGALQRAQNLRNCAKFYTMCTNFLRNYFTPRARNSHLGQRLCAWEDFFIPAAPLRLNHSCIILNQLFMVICSTNKRRGTYCEVAGKVERQGGVRDSA